MDINQVLGPIIPYLGNGLITQPYGPVTSQPRNRSDKVDGACYVIRHIIRFKILCVDRAIDVALLCFV